MTKIIKVCARRLFLLRWNGNKSREEVLITDHLLLKKILSKDHDYLLKVLLNVVTRVNVAMHCQFALSIKNYIQAPHHRPTIGKNQKVKYNSYTQVKGYLYLCFYWKSNHHTSDD